MSVYGLNQEGYLDPTAATAIANVAEAEKYLPLVYVCSKYSGDTVTNTEAAKRYSEFDGPGCDTANTAFVASFVYAEDSERELAMFMDMVFLGKCDELWVFGDKPRRECAWRLLRQRSTIKKIRYFDESCKETNQALEVGRECRRIVK